MASEACEQKTTGKWLTWRGPLDMICDTMCKFDDHMTLRDFPRSRCGKSAGSIAFSVSL